MKATTAMDFSIERNGGSGGGQPLPHRRSIALGIAVSLLLHGALIYLWRHVQPSVPPDTAPRVESIAVWIRPLATKPPPPPVEVIKPKREAKPVSKPKLAAARETPDKGFAEITGRAGDENRFGCVARIGIRHWRS